MSNPLLSLRNPALWWENLTLLGYFLFHDMWDTEVAVWDAYRFGVLQTIICRNVIAWTTLSVSTPRLQVWYGQVLTIISNEGSMPTTVHWSKNEMASQRKQQMQVRCARTLNPCSASLIESAVDILKWIICPITVMRGVLQLYYIVSTTLLLEKVRNSQRLTFIINEGLHAHLQQCFLWEKL